MRRKEQFFPGEYYHIYCRTMFGLPEFKNYDDASKLVQCFLLANSTESARAFDYFRKSDNVSWKKAVEIAWRGDKFVDVVSYAVMPEHYHLLVKELKEGGITSFIRRNNTSIAKYINTKKERKGSLFESSFKAKHVNSNEYLLHLSLYIHLNPLDFIDSKDWRMGSLKNWPMKKKRLLNYPWSSLKAFLYDYEDLVLSGTDIVLDQFKDRKEYENFLREWSVDFWEEIQDVIISDDVGRRRG